MAQKRARFRATTSHINGTLGKLNDQGLLNFAFLQQYSESPLLLVKYDVDVEACPQPSASFDGSCLYP
jgi:hypothetical protein